MSRGRVVFVVGLFALAAFALLAGEFSTFDWLTLRRQFAEEQAAIADLKIDIDSLERLALALETDPAVQERAAREAFGMIRDGEILYRIVPRRPSP